MTLVERLGNTWNHIIDEYSDPRVKDWPLTETPLPTIAIVITYVLFVKRFGPQFMKHRKPYELRKPILIYNFLQVVLSTYIFYKASVHAWLTTYSWRCEPLDRSTTGSPMEVMT